ncbi:MULTISPECIES: hypothetical protein [Aerosakkonema]|uniref:hypothetical protein n=1 Tax=Aerosakkonema TaxID=1246629 RepID=UPI0035B87E84
MSHIRQSILLAFCLLLPLGSIAAADWKPTKSTMQLPSALLPESAPTKPAFPAISPGVKATQNRVKVFFPSSRNTTDLGYVEPVWRTTQRRDLSRFAIEQLIIGPTRTEMSRGLMKPIQFRGSSNCGGNNFTLSISGRVARLKFCKTIPSAGIGDDARVKSSVEATLKQFSTVKSVIILTKEGDCFGDMSGENLCLR